MSDIFTEKSESNQSGQDEVNNDSGQDIKNDEAPKQDPKQQEEFISLLKQENKQMRDEMNELRERVAQSKTVEDVLNRMEKEDRQPAPAESPNGQQALNQPDVESVVEKLLSKKQAEQLAQSNIDLVENELVARFGDKAKATGAIKETQKKYGVDLKKWASESPQAVIKLFESTGEKPTGPLTSSVNTEQLGSFKPTTAREDPEFKEAVKRGDFKMAAKISNKYYR